MLDKNRLIELIQATNKSSDRVWLEQFDCGRSSSSTWITLT